MFAFNSYEECTDIYLSHYSRNILRKLLRSATWNSDNTSSSHSRLQTPISASSLKPLPSFTSRSIGQLPCATSHHCAKHPRIPTDLACLKIHAYMHQQNLGELIPVLVHLGVHSEAHFALLRQAMSVSSSSVSAINSSFLSSALGATPDRLRC